MKNIILRPKNYLRIVIDITKLKLFPPIVATGSVVFIAGIFISTSPILKSREFLGASKGYSEDKIFGTIEGQDLPKVFRNQEGKMEASDVLKEKSFKELSFFLEDGIAELEKEGINTLILKNYLLAALDLNKKGEEEKARQEVLVGIRMMEEIKIAQKLHSQ